MYNKSLSIHIYTRHSCIDNVRKSWLIMQKKEEKEKPIFKNSHIKKSENYE